MRRAPKTRGGIAMLLVVIVMAAAAIMGFALLSSASMQAEASRNSLSSYSVDGVDQSGTNLAIYYLLNPTKASSSVMTTSNGRTFYDPGANVPSISMSNGATLNRIDVSLTSANGMTGNYGIDVTANASSLSTSLKRTQHSDVQLTSRYIVNYALASNGPFTIPLTGVTMTVDGNARCDGGIGGLLSAITGSTIIPKNTAKPTYPTNAVPSYSELNLCKSLPAYYYVNSGGTLSIGTAQFVSGSITSFPAVNAAANPDAVYYSNANLTISGNVTLNGTLVVRGSNKLVINGSSVTMNTRRTGQPALIVGGDLVFNGVLLTSRSLTVNGLCYIGGNFAGSGIATNVQMNVNGAIMWGSSNPTISTGLLLGSSAIHINSATGTQSKDPPYYDVLYVPNLCDDGQVPKGIKLTSTNIH